MPHPLMTMNEETQQAAARARLDAVANLLALAVVRLRSDVGASVCKTRGLANVSEPRVYVRTFKPQGRET